LLLNKQMTSRAEVERQLAELRQRLEAVQAEPEARGAGAGNERSDLIASLQTDIARTTDALDRFGKRDRQENPDSVEETDEDSDEEMDPLLKARRAREQLQDLVDETLATGRNTKAVPALRQTIRLLDAEIVALERQADQQRRIMRSLEVLPSVFQIVAQNRPFEAAKMASMSQELRDIVVSNKARFTESELNLLIARVLMSSTAVSDDYLVNLFRRNQSYPFQTDNSASVRLCSGDKGVLFGTAELFFHEASPREYKPKCLRFLLSIPTIDPTSAFGAAVRNKDLELFRLVVHHPNFAYSAVWEALAAKRKASDPPLYQAQVIDAVFDAGFEFADELTGTPQFDPSNSLYVYSLVRIVQENDQNPVVLRIFKRVFGHPNIQEAARLADQTWNNSEINRIAKTCMRKHKNEFVLFLMFNPRTAEILSSPAQFGDGEDLLNFAVTTDEDLFRLLVTFAQNPSMSAEEGILLDKYLQTEALSTAVSLRKIEVFKTLIALLRIRNKLKTTLLLYNAYKTALRTRFLNEVSNRSAQDVADPMTDMLFEIFRTEKSIQGPSKLSMWIAPIKYHDTYYVRYMIQRFLPKQNDLLSAIFEAQTPSGEFEMDIIRKDILTILLEQEPFRVALQSESGQDWIVVHVEELADSLETLIPFMTSNTVMDVFRKVVFDDDISSERLIRAIINSDKFDPKLFG
jgi:hypothetical protein